MLVAMVGESAITLSSERTMPWGGFATRSFLSRLWPRVRQTTWIRVPTPSIVITFKLSRKTCAFVRPSVDGLEGQAETVIGALDKTRTRGFKGWRNTSLVDK